MNDVPSNVVAFKATGEVTKEDYDTIVIPAIDALVKKQDKINFLLSVETKMKNFTLGALLKDLGVGLKHFTRWHKMAIVCDEHAVVKFTDFFSYVAPGEAKGFTHSELEAAKQWVGN